ncbi:MAG: DUF1697 domain-containing protein [Vicinamibacterales bacterium]|nr:DUF1697 domain-containing protein [Vicinamibacterales bacterium]
MSRRRVALLRGINIGTAKRVAMSDLRTLVSSLGYTEAETLLNSGNVVFTAPAGVRGDPAPRIERAIATELQVSSRVTVLTAAELDAIIGGNPLLARMDNPSRMHVAVLFDTASETAVAPLLAADWGAEAMALGPRAVYVWCPAGVIDSAALKALGKAVRQAVTVRTWSTMLKLQARAGAAGPPPAAARTARPPRRKER